MTTTQATAEAFEKPKISPYKWVAGYVGTQSGYLCQGNGIIGIAITREQAYAQWKSKLPVHVLAAVPLVTRVREGLEPPVEP